MVVPWVLPAVVRGVDVEEIHRSQPARNLDRIAPVGRRPWSSFHWMYRSQPQRLERVRLPPLDVSRVDSRGVRDAVGALDEGSQEQVEGIVRSEERRVGKEWRSRGGGGLRKQSRTI